MVPFGIAQAVGTPLSVSIATWNTPMAYLQPFIKWALIQHLVIMVYTFVSVSHVKWGLVCTHTSLLLYLFEDTHVCRNITFCGRYGNVLHNCGTLIYTLYALYEVQRNPKQLRVLDA